MTTGDRSAGAADMIAVEAIGKTYGSGEHALEALVDVSFAVREGEFVTLVGPSGCGKSTLLQILAGLVPASTGRVVISGRPVTGPAPDTIGVMFQDAWLLPWKTAVENVEFPLALRKVPAAVRRTRFRELSARPGNSTMSSLSSRWIPIPSCRAIPRDSWWARWRIL